MDDIEILKSLLSSHGDLGDNDPEMKALCKGIDALQDLPKYKQLFKMMVISQTKVCSLCPFVKNCPAMPGECEKEVAKYYRQKVGLEVKE